MFIFNIIGTFGVLILHLGGEQYLNSRIWYITSVFIKRYKLGEKKLDGRQKQRYAITSG